MRGYINMKYTLFWDQFGEGFYMDLFISRKKNFVWEIYVIN